jgi:hypothetical protein
MAPVMLNEASGGVSTSPMSTADPGQPRSGTVGRLWFVALSARALGFVLRARPPPFGGDRRAPPQKKPQKDSSRVAAWHTFTP